MHYEVLQVRDVQITKQHAGTRDLNVLLTLHLISLIAQLVTHDTSRL